MTQDMWGNGRLQVRSRQGGLHRRGAGGAGRHRAGDGGARRRLWCRKCHHPGGQARGARHGPRLLTGSARDRPPMRSGRERRGGMDRGRCPGHAIRRPQLRPRHLGHWAHVRSGPQADGERTAPPVRAWRAHCDRVLDTRGPHRREVPADRRHLATAARRLRVAAAVGDRGSRARATWRRSGIRASRGRVDRTLARELRGVHGDALSSADRRTGPNSETSWSTRRSSAGSTTRTKPTTGRCATAASTCWRWSEPSSDTTNPVEPQGPHRIRCRECYFLSMVTRCASAPLCAPATRTVSTPASYDAEIASLVSCAGSLNDRRKDP